MYGRRRRESVVRRIGGGGKFAQHVDRRDAEAAGLEEPAGGLVGGGGLEPDLAYTDLAEPVCGGKHQGPGDTSPAVGGLDPKVVDEPELAELVDGDVRFDGRNEEAGERARIFGDEEDAARVLGSLREPEAVAFYDIGEHRVAGGVETGVHGADRGDHRQNGGNIGDRGGTNEHGGSNGVKPALSNAEVCRDVPVDPSILAKYGGPRPTRPPQSRCPWPAIVTLLVGTAVIVAGFITGRGSPDRMTELMALGIVLAAALAARALYEGWQEDGILGVIWRWERPMGSALTGDRVSGLTLALWWLAALATVLGAVGML